MLLAIDSGNTNIVFAVYEGENIKGEWRASSDAKRTADEYGVWLTHLIHLDNLKTEESIWDSIIARNFFVEGFLFKQRRSLDKLNKELSDRTGQPIERVREDTDRDFYMSPTEAVEYGIIDNVFNKRPINSV